MAILVDIVVASSAFGILIGAMGRGGGAASEVAIFVDILVVASSAFGILIGEDGGPGSVLMAAGITGAKDSCLI